MFHSSVSQPTRDFIYNDYSVDEFDFGGLSPHCFSQAVAKWLDTESKPRILLSSLDLSVRWLNQKAQRLVEDGVLKVLDGCLTPRSAQVGHLLRSASPHEYRCAISMDCKNQPWVVWAKQVSSGPRALVGIVLHQPRQSADFSALISTQTLTPTEGRVVGMLLNGHETGRIAQILNISTLTLKTHIKHAYCKLGVTSRGDLFAQAYGFARP